MATDNTSRIIYFNDDAIRGITLPARFTFPFCYEPHPLTRLAAAELQKYLDTQNNLDHNFGLEADQVGSPIGKMFGVLIVKDQNGRLGYLSAFSGKLAGSNDHDRFVPPVFDMLVENSFFLQEQEVINNVNARVQQLWQHPEYTNLREDLERVTVEAAQQIAAFKAQLKANKQDRKKQRETHKALLPTDEYATLEAHLIRHSLHDKHQLNLLIQQWNLQINEISIAISQFENEIETLKQERRERSASLQQQLFERYVFLNKQGQTKSLHDIFSSTIYEKPPAGAGECATPKLLQYASLHGYQPLAMAEFWWGASPKSEIRQHGQFYPACTGKCKPILGHMLDGIALDDDPLLINPGEDSKLDVVYEDEHLIVVNKPSGLLSVPGVNINDSVYSRLKRLWVGTEPLIIHRLDMATSGLLVVAKTPEAHKHIQRQFLKRTVSKRYTALLSKSIEGDKGEIDLPLRGDFYNRPLQLVCFEHGKKSVTRWQVVERRPNKTCIHFWPLTGRTHQLRMHAAHHLGLHAPIVGDDLYGTADERLCLHAAYLAFEHPVTHARVCFEVKEDF
ncbi:pseudouridine synthase [Mucilaginibacter sp. CSA2-8R]|uniref:RluA family pseudouridine synthase n=1 Tax=Mucilaginibacter sp. CSA2-8R TaxID=3141542 RepID=UPI00315DD366